MCVFRVVGLLVLGLDSQIGEHIFFKTEWMLT